MDNHTLKKMIRSLGAIFFSFPHFYLLLLSSFTFHRKQMSRENFSTG